MKVAIIYYNFLDMTGTDYKIGGIETYLWNLSKLIVERGDEPVLFQPAKTKFERDIDNLKVIGVVPNYQRFRKNIRKDLYEYAMSYIDKSKDIIIFGADHASVKTNYIRSLSIQHGVSWDVPGRLLRNNILGKLPFIPDWICKKYTAYCSYLFFGNTKYRVCVDYNFVNWYRTQVDCFTQENVWVIPNFVDVSDDYYPEMSRYNSDNIKVIFARRFVEIRGLDIMIQVVKNLIDTFDNVEFCFAGEGPGKRLLLDEFKNESRVSILRYLPDESLKIHEKFHIAVVPSIGSEGTSLSLAEAMGAGCAVVATDVGGMTNMVIDSYNGRLVPPCVRSLESALSELISDRKLCLKFGERAASTARNSFSYNNWKAKWTEVLDNVSGCIV